MHAARNGRDHIESLRDGRDVSINGAHVADVTEHKAFRNAVRSAARLYDFQAEPEHIEAMTLCEPGQRAPGQPVLAAADELCRIGRAPPRAGGLGRVAFRLYGPLARPRGVLHQRHLYGARSVRSA